MRFRVYRQNEALRRSANPTTWGKLCRRKKMLWSKKRTTENGPSLLVNYDARLKEFLRAASGFPLAACVVVHFLFSRWRFIGDCCRLFAI
jgi:hypothetical protein